MQIRQATINDLETLTHFNESLAFESEGKVLDHNTAIKGVSELLLNPLKGIYYVAELENQTVGCLMVNFQFIDFNSNFITYIQSVYTRPEFRGRGVFKSLFAHAQNQAQSKGLALRLYADDTNNRALEVYRHLGMTELSHKFYEKDFAFHSK